MACPLIFEGTVKKGSLQHRFQLLWTCFSTNECFGPNSILAIYLGPKVTFTIYITRSFKENLFVVEQKSHNMILKLFTPTTFYIPILSLF